MQALLIIATVLLTAAPSRPGRTPTVYRGWSVIALFPAVSTTWSIGGASFSASLLLAQPLGLAYLAFCAIIALGFAMRCRSRRIVLLLHAVVLFTLWVRIERRVPEPMVDLTTFTRREMEILEYLQRNTERPVSRDELLTRVWGRSNIATRNRSPSA